MTRQSDKQVENLVKKLSQLPPKPKNNTEIKDTDLDESHKLFNEMKKRSS